MVEALEIEWKIAGLLPINIASNCIYYKKNEDKNYANRVFGSPDIDIPSASLEPTIHFHQALGSELRKNFNLKIRRLPYRVPLDGLGELDVKLKFRLFEQRFLVISLQLQSIESNLSISDLIKLQKLTTHPILEAIVRFCFNVHYSPKPSEMMVNGWQCKPLIKLTDKSKSIDNNFLVEILTRHQGLDHRAISEMIDKNSALNFNSDKLLIDKQGVAFQQVTDDKENQLNRFKRISALFEYALYVKAFDSIVASGKYPSIDELQSISERINSVLAADVLLQSVSAKRGWNLLKKELRLKEFNIPNNIKTENDEEQSKLTKLPFYKHPMFLGLSALVGLLAGFTTIYQFLD